MKITTCILTLLCIATAPHLAYAQSESELMPLSPYSGDYASASERPTSVITLRKPATGVSMEVSLRNESDKQEQRNRDLYATIEALQRAVKGVPGFRLEQREIQLRGGDRKGISSFYSRTGPTESVAALVIHSELSPEKSLFEIVKLMRATVSGVSPTGATKITDGPVSLILRDPDQYRREILSKIFDDVEFVKKGLGTDFEVLLNGLDQPVKTRAYNEHEVELWIPYSFQIRSVRELNNPKPAQR